MGGRIAAWGFALVAALTPLATAPAAEATFHLIKVREVYAGSNDDSYVELQMYAAGQNLLGGHSLTVYDSGGAVSHTSTFSSSVSGSQNQSTVLVGDSNVQSKFGVAPDLLDSGLSISTAGGAVCWNAGGLPGDCASWGDFSGGASFEAATGTKAGPPATAGGIGSGKALRRSIASGCPTLLEESDDTDNSAADFQEVTPAPRDNASPITEAACGGAPNTAIDERPPAVTNSTSAGFTYEAPTATSYECRLDSAAFSSCLATGVEYTGLADGSHSFQVRGVNASGPDPTPASYGWRVDTTAPTTTIDSEPADPSPGASASFTFHASESVAKFECSLAQGAAPDSFSTCASGKTYSALADGAYTFKVRATDLASNQQVAPTSYSWTVDNSLADTTAPETTVDTHPADPSTTPTASFTYHSNEPGSTFECALDGGSFAPCPASGLTYPDLTEGPHSFQVRAIDPAANVDPTPAGFSFSVVLAPPPAPSVPPPPQPAPSPDSPSPPDTSFAGKPPARSRDRTPTFRFRSGTPGAGFQCALDRGPFKACRSPLTTKPLPLGRHVLKVRAVSGGVADPTPASFRFKVVRGR